MAYRKLANLTNPSEKHVHLCKCKKGFPVNIKINKNCSKFLTKYFVLYFRWKKGITKSEEIFFYFFFCPAIKPNNTGSSSICAHSFLLYNSRSLLLPLLSDTHRYTDTQPTTETAEHAPHNNHCSKCATGDDGTVPNLINIPTNIITSLSPDEVIPL